MLMLSAGSVRLVSGSAVQRQFVSAASDRDGNHWVTSFIPSGNGASILFRVPLPGRGHHVTVHPNGRIFVAVARRPGNWLVIGDTETGAILRQLQVPADRHLYGHGVFSADGSHFFTTESDFNNREGDSGLIGVWAVHDTDAVFGLERIAEYPTLGVGPHELVLMPDGHTLAIANGGLRTHPDSEREVLNPDTMLPSLVYMDSDSGSILEQRFLPDEFHQASIRHLDVNAMGMVALGMQFQGEPWQQVPLVATHRRGEDFRLLLADEPLQGQMQQYVGSVRFAQDGRSFMTSCPRGNQLVVWDAASGLVADSVRSRDGCGICAVGDGFVFTAGTGKLAIYHTAQAEVLELETGDALKLMWDNHLSEV
jgi:hypothetical protein